MLVMTDQHDRAGELVDRLDEHLAALDVEVVGRLVEDQQGRCRMGDERQVQPRPLAAREIGDRHKGLLLAKAKAAEPRTHRLRQRIAHQLGEMVVG